MQCPLYADLLNCDSSLADVAVGTAVLQAGCRQTECFQYVLRHWSHVFTAC